MTSAKGTVQNGSFCEAPQARGCGLIQGNNAVFGLSLETVVFPGLFSCPYLSANTCTCVFVYKFLHVLQLASSNILPWQLLFLVVHI